MFKDKVTFIIFPGIGSGTYEGFLFIGDKQEAHVRNRILDSEEESLWNPGMTVQESYTHRRATAPPRTLARREWTTLKDVDEVTSALMEKFDEYKHNNSDAWVKKSPVIKVVSTVEAMVHRNRASRNSSIMSAARDSFAKRDNFFIWR